MRLFIAIRFSSEVKNALLGVIEDMRAQGVRGNFTKLDNLHLTLAFIGESSRTAELRQIMDGLPLAPFRMTISGSGRFGELYWAGTERSDELSALAAQLTTRLLEAGFDVDRRKFTPHITLAREISPAGAVKPVVPTVTQTVDEIALIKSERINGRLTYTPVYIRRFINKEKFC